MADLSGFEGRQCLMWSLAHGPEGQVEEMYMRLGILGNT